jgi:hypothetical protein
MKPTVKGRGKERGPASSWKHAPAGQVILFSSSPVNERHACAYRFDPGARASRSGRQLNTGNQQASKLELIPGRVDGKQRSDRLARSKANAEVPIPRKASTV